MDQTMDQNNLIEVEQHFHTNFHDFNRDTKFSIIERSEKDINTESIMGGGVKQKRKRQQMNKKSETYVPFGFNMKLNHRTLKWKFDNHKHLYKLTINHCWFENNTMKNIHQQTSKSNNC